MDYQTGAVRQGGVKNCAQKDEKGGQLRTFVANVEFQSKGRRIVLKKYIVLAAFVFGATASFAGVDEPPMEPPEEVTSSSDSDLTGALVLLALVGMVIASSSLNGRAKTEKDPFLLSSDETDN